MNGYQVPPDITLQSARRIGAGWLVQQDGQITINLPADVHAELKARADHDGASLEDRIVWLLTELVRRNWRKK